jgi:O6-methylguanine-DNA--protein-cysteine methyltransferase
MGIGEIATPFRKRIHVRSARLGMTSKESSPVIEIIDANHQDIGSCSGRNGILLILLRFPCHRFVRWGSRLVDLSQHPIKPNLGPSYEIEDSIY